MPIHSVSRDVQPQLSQVDLKELHPPSSQGRLGSEVSTLLSLRESVNADSLSFCDCFARFVDWIKSLLFGSRTEQGNAPAPITETLNPHPRERIMEKVNQSLDFLYIDGDWEGVSFPVDVIVVVKYNSEILSTSFQRVVELQRHSFVATTKDEVRHKLDLIDEAQLVPAALEVETNFIVRHTANMIDPTRQIRRIHRETDLRDGSVEVESTVTETHSLEDFRLFLGGLSGGNQSQFHSLANFLFPPETLSPYNFSIFSH